MTDNPRDLAAAAVAREPRDGDLARRFAAGDEIAAGQVGARVDRILSFRGFGVPAEERRDLRQDVVIQVLRAVRRDAFDFSQGFWGFVETVASRRIIDWLRARRPLVELDERADELSDRSPAADEALAAREQLALGRAVLAQLDGRCRDLIARYVRRGESYRVMAGDLGVSEGALRVQLHRCVKRARALVQEIASTRPGGKGEPTP